MNRFRTFASDRRGTVTQFLTIAMLPLMGITGLAVDYARSTQAKSEIQGALDSTALMLTREAPKKDVAALKKLADPYFAALIASKRPEYAFSGIAVQKTDKIVSVSTNAAVKTFFGGIYAWFGASNANSWTVDVASTAAYGTKKIELALVLDNTGSMASANKIVELKKASHTLLTMLQSAATAPDQVKVAVVPYTTQVRLDTTYKNANWLTTTPTGTFIGGAGYTVPASRDFWNGCIADRDTGYNADTKPVSIPVAKSLYPMVNCVGGGIARMMPLSSNFAALHTRIDEMKADGMTNITLGAQWGYEMLSANAPFTEASADSNVERFMVLLTDGQNTQDRWGIYNEARQNKDTQAMCDAIVERGLPEAAKKLKIKLYTVLVINGNESLLKNCASNPSMYSKVNQASELEAVFKKIAKDIGTIHLTM